jgi:hypothetical protein
LTKFLKSISWDRPFKWTIEVKKETRDRMQRTPKDRRKDLGDKAEKKVERWDKTQGAQMRDRRMETKNEVRDKRLDTSNRRPEETSFREGREETDERQEESK